MYLRYTPTQIKRFAKQLHGVDLSTEEAREFLAEATEAVLTPQQRYIEEALSDFLVEWLHENATEH